MKILHLLIIYCIYVHFLIYFFSYLTSIPSTRFYFREGIYLDAVPGQNSLTLIKDSNLLANGISRVHGHALNQQQRIFSLW